MLAGALHRDRLPWAVREEPGDAVVKTVGMAVVAVAPAGVGHSTCGTCRGGGVAFWSDAGVEQLMSQVDDRFLRSGRWKRRRLDPRRFVVERWIVAGDVHGRDIPGDEV